MYALTYLHTDIATNQHTYIHIYIKLTFIYAYIPTCPHAHILTYKQNGTLTYESGFIHAYLRTYTPSYIHTHTLT